MKAIKKPIEVDFEFAKEDGEVETLGGKVKYKKGDAIITGVKGEKYPCRRDIFDQTYWIESPPDATSVIDILRECERAPPSKPLGFSPDAFENIERQAVEDWMQLLGLVPLGPMKNENPENSDIQNEKGITEEHGEAVRISLPKDNFYLDPKNTGVSYFTPNLYKISVKRPVDDARLGILMARMEEEGFKYPAFSDKEPPTVYEAPSTLAQLAGRSVKDRIWVFLHVRLEKDIQEGGKEISIFNEVNFYNICKGDLIKSKKDKYKPIKAALKRLIEEGDVVKVNIKGEPWKSRDEEPWYHFRTVITGRGLPDDYRSELNRETDND